MTSNFIDNHLDYLAFFIVYSVCLNLPLSFRINILTDKNLVNTVIFA